MLPTRSEVLCLALMIFSTLAFETTRILNEIFIIKICFKRLLKICQIPFFAVLDSFSTSLFESERCKYLYIY